MTITDMFYLSKTKLVPSQVISLRTTNMHLLANYSSWLSLIFQNTNSAILCYRLSFACHYMDLPNLQGAQKPDRLSWHSVFSLRG